MRKQSMSLMLAALMIGGSLAGCSGSKPAETTAASTEAAKTEAAETTAETTAGAEAKDVKLTFTWWGNQLRNDRTQEVLDMYSAANPGVTFDAQPAQWSDYWTKLATAAAGNALPDLIQMGYTSALEQYVDNGLLEDLGPYVESGLLDVSAIDQSILDSGSVDGKLYAICSGQNAPALIYNKTLTDELGIEIKNNMTLDEFMDVSREIYEKSGVKTDLAFANAESMMTYILRGEGVENMFKDKRFVSDDSSMFEPFFQVYETGYQEGWMLKAEIYAELTKNSVEQCPLVYYSTPETQSWCACYWSNQLNAMQSAAPEGVELAYSTWPAKDPVKADYLHPSMFFCVSANSAEKEEAVKVLNYLINDIDCNKVLLAERGIPATTVVADAISAELPEASQKEIEFINTVVAPNASTISPCAPTTAAEFFKKADNLVEEILYGAKTAKDASAELYTEGQKILAQ